MTRRLLPRPLAGLVLSALFVVAPAFAAGLSAKDADAVRAAITRSNDALVRGDVDTVVDCTADPLVAAIGGRDRYAPAIRNTVKMMRDHDLHVVSHTMEPPGAPVTADGFLVTVVRESTVMSSHGQRSRTDGFTVAVRPVTGGPWKLIGGKGIAQAPQVMQQLFPGFPANYVFPPFTEKAE